MDWILNDEETIAEKNWYLWPIFSDLKLIIWKISKTRENELLWEFYVSLCKVLGSWADKKSIKDTTITNLKSIYAIKI